MSINGWCVFVFNAHKVFVQYVLYWDCSFHTTNTANITASVVLSEEIFHQQFITWKSWRNVVFKKFIWHVEPKKFRCEWEEQKVGIYIEEIFLYCSNSSVVMLPFIKNTMLVWPCIGLIKPLIRSEIDIRLVWEQFTPCDPSGNALVLLSQSFRENQPD